MFQILNRAVIVYMVVSVSAAFLLLACGPAAPPAQPGELPAIQSAPPPALVETAPTDLPVTQSPAPQEDDGAQEETEGEGDTEGEEEEKPTPTPTPTSEPPCPHTQGDYPKLDDTLKDLVRNFETCDLTEEEAAAKAPDHHGVQVLIQAILNLEDTTPKPIEAWMDEQGMNPRYTVMREGHERVYAFVQVSRLGALSKRNNVSFVEIPPNEYQGVIFEFPKPEPPRGASGTPSPELPPWLWQYEHPRTYPGLPYRLKQIASLHDLGKSVAEIGKMYPCGMSEGRAGFGFWVKTEQLAAVLKWIKDNNGSPRDQIYVESHPEGGPYGGYSEVAASLPPSKLEAFGIHPDVEDIKVPPCNFGSGTSYLDQNEFSSDPQQVYNVVSKGVRGCMLDVRPLVFSRLLVQHEWSRTPYFVPS